MRRHHWGSFCSWGGSAHTKLRERGILPRAHVAKRADDRKVEMYNWTSGRANGIKSVGANAGKARSAMEWELHGDCAVCAVALGLLRWPTNYLCPRSFFPVPRSCSPFTVPPPVPRSIPAAPLGAPATDAFTRGIAEQRLRGDTAVECHGQFGTQRPHDQPGFRNSQAEGDQAQGWTQCIKPGKGYNESASGVGTERQPCVAVLQVDFPPGAVSIAGSSPPSSSTSGYDWNASRVPANPAVERSASTPALSTRRTAPRESTTTARLGVPGGGRLSRGFLLRLALRLAPRLLLGRHVIHDQRASQFGNPGPDRSGVVRRAIPLEVLGIRVIHQESDHPGEPFTQVVPVTFRESACHPHGAVHPGVSLLLALPVEF